MDRETRRLQLLRWSVIIVAVLAVFMYLAWGIVGVQRALSPPTAPKAVTVSMTLPEKCRPLYNRGDDNWINCMGVGYR